MCQSANPDSHFGNANFQAANGMINFSYTVGNLKSASNYTVTTQWGTSQSGSNPFGTEQCTVQTDQNGSASGGVNNLPGNIFDGGSVTVYLLNPDGSVLSSYNFCSDLLTSTTDPSTTPATPADHSAVDVVQYYDPGVGYSPPTSTSTPTPTPSTGCPEVPSMCWYPWA